MPSSFSRLDLPSTESLDHVLQSVLEHSTALLRKQLELDGLEGEQEEQVCRRVLEMWIADAKQKLQANVTVEGVSWRERQAQSQAMAPLDTQLSNRLNNLSRTVDELTEEIVIHRRELPQRHAEALKAREEVQDSLRDRLEDERREVVKGGWGSEDLAPKLPVSRQEQIQKTLSTALSQADALAETLPAQARAVQEQHELVTQLRSMPP